MDEISLCDSLREHILANFGSYYPDLKGQRVDILIPNKPRRGRRSFLCEFEVVPSSGLGEKRVILAKVPKKLTTRLVSEAVVCPESVRKAEHEYRRLCEVYSLIRTAQAGNLGAVTPLGYLSKCNAIITEKIRGTSLSNEVARCSSIIGRNKAHQEKLKHYVRSCAEWLRLFHTMSTDNAGELRYDFSEYRASMSKIVQLLGDRGVDQDSLTFARHSVKKALYSSQLAFSPSEVAYLHGDYQTKNVIISNGRVYCLDMDGQTVGLVYEDVARFLISLRITKSLMILHGLLLDDELVEALQSEFLSSYFQNESWSTGLLRLYLLKAVLQKWSRAALTVNHFKPRCFLRRVILASTINPVFRAEIRKIL